MVAWDFPAKILSNSTKQVYIEFSHSFLLSTWLLDQGRLASLEALDQPDGWIRIELDWQADFFFTRKILQCKNWASWIRPGFAVYRLKGPGLTFAVRATHVSGAERNEPDILFVFMNFSNLQTVTSVNNFKEDDEVVPKLKSDFGADFRARILMSFHFTFRYFLTWPAMLERLVRKGCRPRPQMQPLSRARLVVSDSDLALV